MGPATADPVKETAAQRNKRSLNQSASYGTSATLTDELRHSRNSFHKSSRPRLQPSSAASSRSSSIHSLSSGSYPAPRRAEVDIGADSFVSGILGNRPHDRRLSNEQLIDVMEKEQDAIVLRLMREISALKDENRFLRQHIAAENLSVGPATPSTLPTPRTSVSLSPASGAIADSP